MHINISKYTNLKHHCHLLMLILHYDSCSCKVSNHFSADSQVIILPPYLPLLWFITPTLSLVYITLGAIASSCQISVNLIGPTPPPNRSVQKLQVCLNVYQKVCGHQSFTIVIHQFYPWAGHRKKKRKPSGSINRDVKHLCGIQLLSGLTQNPELMGSRGQVPGRGSRR